MSQRTWTLDESFRRNIQQSIIFYNWEKQTFSSEMYETQGHGFCRHACAARWWKWEHSCFPERTWLPKCNCTKLRIWHSAEMRSLQVMCYMVGFGVQELRVVPQLEFLSIVHHTQHEMDGSRVGSEYDRRWISVTTKPWSIVPRTSPYQYP